MTKKFFAVATFAFAMAFAVTAGAVNASDIYTPASGLLQVGSGMGAKAYQAPNVMAAQKALNACQNSNIAEDGKFGPITAGLFKTFQTAKGIKIDGIIGSQTAATLAACSGGVTTTPTTPTTTLSGGAGEIDLSSTSTDVEDTVKEGEDNVIILGIKAEADGSDIALTSVKVSFKNTGYASSSENLEKYVDSVSIWLGDKEVGSADVDDFSKDSGTPDEFSKTISLSGAVIDEDDEEKLYVAVSAASTIDSDDIDNAVWDIEVDTVRFNDATGAILSADVGDFEYADNDAFTFEDSSTDDQIDLKSSSANPDDMTVKVEENDDSDDILALAFKLDVDEDSSDVFITNLPIVLDVTAGGTTTDSIENIVDKVTVKVGSDEWEADLDEDNVENGSGDATYSVDFDDDEFTVDSGDVSEVKVYVTFKEQDGNYDLNTTVTASVVNEDISAETEDDELDVDGSDQTGGELTLNISVASISNVSWQVGSKGSFIDFLFTLEAEDDEVDVVIGDVDSTEDESGGASVGTPVLTKISGDASGTTDDYTVADGDTARFRVRFPVTGDDGEYANVSITSVAGQDIADDDQVSPTATLDIN